MKSAIDNYALGKQIEVKAVIGETCSWKTKRYTCSECGEYVTLDRRGHFVHRERTIDSDECDKRVDGSSASIYERIGQPLILRCSEISGSRQFELYIGFNPISEISLRQAEQLKLTISISGSETRYNNLYSVSSTRFSNEMITPIPVDFYPMNGRYEITYSSNSITEINKKWTGYALAFFNGCALFTCEEDGGRKIRHHGTITTDTEYYCVCRKDRHPNYSSLSMILVGELTLRNEKLDVLRIRYDSKNCSKSDFAGFDNYCMNHMGVRLLNKQPSIFPIWPPCRVIYNQYISVVNTAFQFFAVDTPNDNPIIYEYYHNDMTIQQEIRKTEDGKTYFSTTIGSNEKPISVDRKYGSNVFFVKRQILELKEHSQNTIISVGNSMNEDHTILLSRKSENVSILTNYKGKALHMKNNGSVIAYGFHVNASLSIDDVKSGERIEAWNNYRMIDYFDFVYHAVESKDNSNDRTLMDLLAATGESIPIPCWVINLLQVLPDGYYTQLIRNKYLASDRIPIHIVRELLQISES